MQWAWGQYAPGFSDTLGVAEGKSSGGLAAVGNQQLVSYARESVGDMTVVVKRRSAFAVGSAAVLGGVIGAMVPSAPASATASTCIGAPGIAILNQDCVTVYGNSPYVPRILARAWRATGSQLSPIPLNICGYQVRFWGTLPDGASYNQYSNYQAGCDWAFPKTIDNYPQRNFKNDSYAGAEWKENNVWSGRYLAICVHEGIFPGC